MLALQLDLHTVHQKVDPPALLLLHAVADCWEPMIAAELLASFEAVLIVHNPK